jgi:hypothetical protein
MLAVALVAILGFGPGFSPAAQASLVLDMGSVPGANIEFKGSGTGASFVFNNNSGQGFVVTSSNGVGDSVGLHGTLGGTYSYTTASIDTSGLVKTAPVLTSDGTLTITDGLNPLTGTIAGIDVTTVGSGGLINLNGTVNLSTVSYSGTNADLKQLRDEAALGGGIVTLSFQFIPSESLTQFAATTADFTTSYSGTIATAVPEPSSLVVAGFGALACLGWSLRRRSRSVGCGRD